MKERFPGRLWVRLIVLLGVFCSAFDTLGIFMRQHCMVTATFQRYAQGTALSLHSRVYVVRTCSSSTDKNIYSNFHFSFFHRNSRRRPTIDSEARYILYMFITLLQTAHDLWYYTILYRMRLRTTVRVRSANIYRMFTDQVNRLESIRVDRINNEHAKRQTLIT